MFGRAVRVVLAFLKGSFLVMGYMGVDKHDGFDGWGRYVEPKCPCQARMVVSEGGIVTRRAELEVT